MLTRFSKGRPGLPVLSFSARAGWLALWFTALCLLAPTLRAQGGLGIGGYDLLSSADQAVAFDYSGSGHADHLLLYRPGTGNVWILSNSGGDFSAVFTSSTGIGGYDLRSTNDRIVPFDYNGSGLSDHLVCYRPGTGIIWILENIAGAFTPVFTGSAGIGNFDLGSTADRIITFDYDGSGLSDHLLIYRPGTGVVYILQNTQGSFSTIFSTTSGIGGYDLSSTADRIAAFDLYSIGSADHLIAYRPGQQTAWILENSSGTFTSLQSYNAGIGGYDLKSAADQILPFDYYGNGSPDHLLLYRPGTGIVWILENRYFTWTPVYESLASATGAGIGGYNLYSSADQITTFDYNSSGLQDHLLLYRPGDGIAFIVQNQQGTFSPVYTSPVAP